MEREKHILTSGGSVPPDVCGRGQYEPESHLTNHKSQTIRITLLFSSHYISSAFIRVLHSLVFLSIAEQTGQRDVGQLDTLALAWRPSDKCSYFVWISSSLQITGTICRDVVRTAFWVLFTMNEYFEYVIVIIPLQGSLLGRLNRKILFWKHNNILFLFSVL